jgi:hypothetical protein
MYQIRLEKEDYLRFLLFTASKSKRMRTKRIRSWILTTLVFLCIGLVFYQKEDKFTAYYFMISAAICLLLYPFYYRWRYKQFYEKYIHQNYKNRIGVETEVGFADGFMTSKNRFGEEKIRLTEIEFIYEIKDNLFIRMKNGETIIIPCKSPDYAEFRGNLMMLTKGSGIVWQIELDWKWR